jgi:antitoxin VapB
VTERVVENGEIDDPHEREIVMFAKLIIDGEDQVVVLPKECRIDGDEVSVTKVGDSIILRPIQRGRPTIDWDLLDSLTDEPFMPEGRDQPPIPDDPPSFDE